MNTISASLRFWSKVAITANPDKCWNWQERAVGRGGYGKIGWGIGARTTKLAHHVAWFLTHDKWPDDCLLHFCDNVKCVNPKHLREGSRIDNAKDRDARQRTLYGEKHPSATLTEQEVIAIRLAYVNGKRIIDLARQYHRSHGCIDSIVKKRAWKHI